MNSVLSFRVAHIKLGVKNLPANVENARDCGFDPWVGKIPWSRKWSLLQYSCLKDSMDRGVWHVTVHSCTVKSLSRFSHVQLFVTPWTVARPLLCPWDSPGKNLGMGCHTLLQGIFLTQGYEPHFLHLLHWQEGSLSLAPPRKTQLESTGAQRVGHVPGSSPSWSRVFEGETA